MAKIQNIDRFKYWQGYRATGTLLAGMVNGKATLEESLQVSFTTQYTMQQLYSLVFMQRS